jgi:hypothetical protein
MVSIDFLGSAWAHSFTKATNDNEDVDENGMYKDINVIDIDQDDSSDKKKIDPTADVKHFFTEPFSCEGHGKKKQRKCKIFR